jgi:plastocyanin
MRRIPLLLLMCAVTALGAAGCGGDDNGGSTTSATSTTGTTTQAATGATGATGAKGGKANVIKIEADPSQLAFKQKSVTAKAGKNTIDFNNPASIPHDVKIEENGKDVGGTDLVTNGEAKATVTLDAGGSYTFYCSVPGHRQAGMEGKLTVK